MFNQNQHEGAAVFGRYLLPAEQRRLLGTIRQYSSEVAKRDGAVCRLLIGSGMRIGETLLISVGDAAAALQSGHLFIPKEHRKAEACDLSVLLTRSVRAALEDLLALRDGAELDEALIVSRKSKVRGWKAMTVRAFELRVAYWAKLAGLPEGVSPHWFRHTHAKNIMRESEAADPLRVAQLSLGQISRRSTEIYTKLDREELEAALHQVDGKVNGKPRLRLADLRKAHEGRARA
jgi:site-specific recombinase XerC